MTQRFQLIAAAVALAGLTACGPERRDQPVTDGRDTGVTTTDQRDRTDATADQRDRTDTMAPGTAATTGMQTMTVRGCVTEQNGQVMLTQVEPTTGTRETGQQAYQLVGETQQLREHVGHRVEVMGTQDTARTGDQARAGDTTGRDTVGTAGMDRTGQASLRVSSIRQVEGDCPVQR